MTETATASKNALAPVPVKAIEPQNLFDQFDQLHDSIAHRAFEIFEDNGRVFGRDLENWLRAQSELLHSVPVNMAETDDALTIQAEVPGFTAKELEIQLEPRQLTISGTRQTSEEKRQGKAVYQEQCSNQILRVIDLPVDIDTAKTTATLKNGMLEVQMPKSATAKTTRVEVKAA